MQALPLPYLQDLLERIAVSVERQLHETPITAYNLTSLMIKSIMNEELFKFDYKNPEADWLIKNFDDALYARKNNYPMSKEAQKEYQQLINELEKIIHFLLDKKETKTMGEELDSLTGALIGLLEDEYYKQGIRDGYTLARMLNETTAERFIS